MAGPTLPDPSGNALMWLYWGMAGPPAQLFHPPHAAFANGGRGLAQPPDILSVRRSALANADGQTTPFPLSRQSIDQCSAKSLVDVV